ncbi:endonuclease dU [Deinococcus radiodurans]|uniref:UPF0215 protein DR_A0167 n=1 Tax=Deinococcus radiodurans (strain ATCC 13939 / DSM 20539 / JCM 16871 / CCUG 27074 / LMG 4051 / NBRC 15346 / NCIMB 9279 / VKM B-1422 / R1) TaxID=243230 RepID=Y2867_DEIRA|nr:DUF99 family protein [Deinococcus radiodurans]Q9RYY6.1 RecName: Full=UPF0215 protein DR_A0167 [Deinococcus radiodurans R1 = ATCC 13939 = DSM 20539]AAF12296.1 conserved hypothetical protein [Deinococcus radiodurans R1 = ATCC 13939 = DSM 20539]ANC73150.1 hypothetical protein A2G07_14315 [Deinococcus radiodurans R1 = ATCC 13939 = DSM 20539]QEM73197.1 DUF99 family protein [Deinococcus radiodurans]QIP30340.1 DUF99 family protein [Deinococcus radiodurans]QIP33302.1 DUF99 family protein [Deinococ
MPVPVPRAYPRLSHAIGFDDAPFAREWRGDVRIFGAVYAGPTLHAVVSGRVRRDGRNATDELSRLVTAQAEHLQLVFLQGIALAGFNVVDLGALHARTGLPVLVVARRKPRLDRIRRALLEEVPGGARKWRLIEQAGEMEPCAGLYVQRAGLLLAEAEAALGTFCLTGRIPEPLRTAHLIAGGVTRGSSAGQRV